MIIKVSDIPPEGRNFDFELDTAMLNERVNAVRKPAKVRRALLPPEYLFSSPPHVKLRLQMAGSSVQIHGTADGVFRASCSRCAEELESPIHADVDIVLKPRLSEDSGTDEFEDVGFGYYDGKVVDCGEIVQEFLILSLPYTVTCDVQNAEQCARAQQNLAAASSSETASQGDERFAILRSLKVNGNKGS